MIKRVKEWANKHKTATLAMLCALTVAMGGTASAETANEPDEGLIETLIGVVSDVIAIFTEPPLVWFVVLGLVAAGIGIVRKLIPKKGAS